MNVTKIGRLVGAALLVQMGIAPIAFFGLLPPGTDSAFLETAAAHDTRIRIALLLLLVAAAMTMVIAIGAFPLFRLHGERLALLYVGLAVAGLATISAEMVATRDMLSLSLEYARVGAPRETLEALAPLASRHRVTAHFMNLAVAHAAILVLWLVLYRARYVPRALSGFGVAASILSTAAVLGSMTGIPFHFLAVQPLGFATLALVSLLLWRGFAAPDPLT